MAAAHAAPGGAAIAAAQHVAGAEGPQARGAAAQSGDGHPVGIQHAQAGGAADVHGHDADDLRLPALAAVHGAQHRGVGAVQRPAMQGIGKRQMGDDAGGLGQACPAGAAVGGPGQVAVVAAHPAQFAVEEEHVRRPHRRPGAAPASTSRCRRGRCRPAPGWWAKPRAVSPAAWWGACYRHRRRRRPNRRPGPGRPRPDPGAETMLGSCCSP